MNNQFNQRLSHGDISWFDLNRAVWLIILLSFWHSQKFPFHSFINPSHYTKFSACWCPSHPFTNRSCIFLFCCLYWYLFRPLEYPLFWNPFFFHFCLSKSLAWIQQDFLNARLESPKLHLKMIFLFSEILDNFAPLLFYFPPLYRNILYIFYHLCLIINSDL